MSPFCLRNVGPPYVRCSNVWKSLANDWKKLNVKAHHGRLNMYPTNSVAAHGKRARWRRCPHALRVWHNAIAEEGLQPNAHQTEQLMEWVLVMGAETWIVFSEPPRGFASICILFILLLVLCLSDWRFGQETIRCGRVWHHDMTITMLFLFVVWTIFLGYFYQIWTTLWLSPCVLRVY